jgi:serine phosphatase RsbU (regulator of sigma subunit)
MRVDVDSQLNTEYENKNKSGQFMTLFYLTVDQDSGCLEWVRAGHDPGIFYDPEKGPSMIPRRAFSKTWPGRGWRWA